jgi:hypothetical protein
MASGSRHPRRGSSKDPGLPCLKDNIDPLHIMHTPSLHQRQLGQLLHLNFDHGKAKRHVMAPDPWFLAEMAPLLTRGQGAAPDNPNVVLSVKRGFDGAPFVISIRGKELLTAAVAWGPRDCWSLHAFLIHSYERTKGSSFPSDWPLPDRLPWLGTVGSPMLQQLPRRFQARLLARSRRFAIAIMSHTLAAN